MGTKTVKISECIYESLIFLKGMDIKETMSVTINKLLGEIDPLWSEVTSENGVFYLTIEGRKKAIPTFPPATKIIRIDIDLHDRLTKLRIHPDETFNTLLYRLISLHYGNKPLYRIFTGTTCSSCEMLAHFINKKLVNIPEIANGIRFEYVYARDHGRYMCEFDATYPPLSILYDANGKIVWFERGLHNYNEVQSQLESILK